MATQTRYGVGVFVFIFNKDFSKVLLIKRNQEKREKYGFAWGTPGGKLELGEYSLDGAVREVREETGINLDKKSVKLLEMMELPNFTESVHGFAFKYGAIADEKLEVKLNEESDEHKWFDVNNLPEDMIVHDNILEMAKIAKKKFKK